MSVPEIAAADVRAELEQARLRPENALEINDNIVQGVAVTKYALELGENEKALAAADETLAAAKEIVSDLVGELLPSDPDEPTDVLRRKDRPRSGSSEGEDDRPTSR